MAQYQHMLMRGSRTYHRNRHHHTFMRNYNIEHANMFYTSHESYLHTTDVFNFQIKYHCIHNQSARLSSSKIHQQITLHKEILNTNHHHVFENHLKLLDIHKFKPSPPQELPIKGVHVSLVRKTPTDAWIIPNRMKTKTMKHKSSNGVMSPSTDD